MCACPTAFAGCDNSGMAGNNVRWLWDRLGHVLRIKTVCDLIGLSGAEWWRAPVLASAGVIGAGLSRIAQFPAVVWFLFALLAILATLGIIELVHKQRARLEG